MCLTTAISLKKIDVTKLIVGISVPLAVVIICQCGFICYSFSKNKYGAANNSSYVAYTSDENYSIIKKSTQEVVNNSNLGVPLL